MGNRKAKPRISNPSLKSPDPPRKPLPPEENLPDGVTLLWLDEKANSSSSNSQTTRRMLRELHSSVRCIHDCSTGRDFLRSQSNKQARVFLLLSGKLHPHILPDLDQMSVIDSIFLFCYKAEKYQHLLSQHSPHLIGIYSKRELLKSSLEIALDEYCQREPIVKFFAQKQNNIRDLTHEQAAFLWFQLLQQILIHTKYGPNEMKQMLDYCREHYSRRADRKKFLPQIEEFERTYQSSRAISWYTRESFIYRLINRALRTEDIDALYIFRFYISDLSRQLLSEHEQFSRRRGRTRLTLYRGSHISADELERLRESMAGRLISINGFVSTSEAKWVAERFKDKESSRGSTRKVLWIIEIDIRINDVIFAEISSHSEHSDEEEILFNLGSVYKLEGVSFDDHDQTWHVRVTATNMGSQLVSEYIELNRQEIGESSEKVIFGTLLMDMGKYETAQTYFQKLVEGGKDPDLPAFHYNLGLTYAYGGDYELAEFHFEEALQYQLPNPNQQRNVIRTKNALGLVYQNSGDLDGGMAFYQQAEVDCNKRLGSDDIANAQTFIYMGKYHLEKKEYPQSMECYERAMKILHLRLPKEHQRFGILLTEMGNVQREQGEHRQALDLYQQAEKVFEKILPEHHPCKAYCWSMMGLVHLHLQESEKAREFHAKALDCYKRVLPRHHVNIMLSEKNFTCTCVDHIIDTYEQVCAQV